MTADHSQEALAGREDDIVAQTAFTEEDLRYCRVPLVYVAGPYVNPDPVENTHNAIRVGDALNMTGKVATFVPHLTLLAHMVVPRVPEHWYAFDFAFVAKADALLRLPGASSGADKEVALAKMLDLPVFYSDEDLLAWADEFVSDIP